MHAATYPEHFTIDDLYALPDDGMRHELVDGTLLVSPPPANRHQLVVTRLARLLATAMPHEIEVLDGPGVRLSGSRVLQPDLVIGPRAELTADVLYLPTRAVLAIIEVVSPSNSATDRITKPALYAAAGIPTYIRVELGGPEAPEIHVGRLDADAEAYRPQLSAHAGQTLHIDEPFPASFDPAELTR